MAELILTDVEPGVLRRLEARAAGHGRTPADEAKAMLADALSVDHDAWAEVDAIYQRLAASGRAFSDSAELLREDRDR